MPTKAYLRQNAKDCALISLFCLGITLIPAGASCWSVNEASKTKSSKAYLVVPLEQLQDVYQKNLEEYCKTGSKKLLENTEISIEETKVKLGSLEEELKKYQVNTPEMVEKIGTAQRILQEILSQHSIFGASYKEYAALKENKKIIQEQDKELKEKIYYNDDTGPLGFFIILTLGAAFLGGCFTAMFSLEALTNYTKSFFAIN